MSNNLNELLLVSYQDAGAVSKNINDAEKEALIVQGATDGKWGTYLASQGYVGSTNDMLYQYLGDKGFSGCLNDRLLQACVAGELFATPYSLSFDALGLTGVDGFIYDGTVANSFFIDSTLETPCSTSGVSPVGGWVDLSGNGNHATQATSALRPIYYSGTNVQYVRTSYVAGMARHLVVPTLSSQEKLTIYLVMRDSGGGRSYPLVLQDNATGWPAGTNFIGNDGTMAIYDGSMKANGTYWQLGSGGPIRVVKQGTGSGQTSIFISRALSFSSGVWAYEATAQLTATNNDAAALAATDDASTGHYEMAFVFVAASDIGATARATIESYILNNPGFQEFCNA